jgi:carboxylesterase type B
VWIHGGGFTGGAGQDTDPRKYVGQSGAVFVTINYRLGALGFLTTPQLRQEGDGAGSFGLLDQQTALRWVQRNIARFGGNPDDVTIAGQSAGGSSVCDQLASPAAAGLFQRAIIHSGGCSMTSQADADTAGQAYVKTARVRRRERCGDLRPPAGAAADRAVDARVRLRVRREADAAVLIGLHARQRRRRRRIGFWSSFQRWASRNGPYLPRWPKFNTARRWMSLDACESAESSNQPPASCSRAKALSSLAAYHKLDLWHSVLGSA